MLRIGLTGGIASGKSSVARLLARHGARVIDADVVAHETYAPGTAGFAGIVAAFGADVVGADGAIDRRVLGRLVFADAERRARLTGIVWPLTRERVEALVREAEAAGTPICVVEAALLIEAGWRAMFDEVWLVRTPDALARERLMQRNQITAAEAESRLASQPAAEERIVNADRVIDNDGSVEELEMRVEAALKAALERRK